MEVTNTNDSGSGSLRACVQASGPRTCIFRVAGVFNITSGDNIATSPYLTIACQTAPGEVIIGGPHASGAALRISTHDVIVRYCIDTLARPSGY
jgi:pectate lyase